MRTFLNIGLLPIGLLVAVVLIAQGLIGGMLALVWVFIVLPFGVHRLIGCSAEGKELLRDIETHYWRTGSR